MIHFSEFIHPEDEAARNQLEAIPGFPSATKAFLKIGIEQLMHGMFMSEKIRLSPTQLPDLYHLLPPICRLLDIPEPEFYLEMNPLPNAYTLGDTRLFICITSGLIEHLDTEELRSVLAHECGHIACRHVLYHTMADLLLLSSEVLGISKPMLLPIQWGLLYWRRRSELSADRAAAVISGGSKEIIETHIRLSGGPIEITKQINIEEFAAQSKAYELLKEKKWDRFLQGLVHLEKTHPASAVRINEILRWADDPKFSSLVEGLHNQTTKLTTSEICPTCKNPFESEWKYCRFCGQSLKMS